MTTIERAFELAKSGQWATLEELVRQLQKEGYNGHQIEGDTLRKQLRALIRTHNKDAAAGKAGAAGTDTPASPDGTEA